LGKQHRGPQNHGDTRKPVQQEGDSNTSCDGGGKSKQGFVRGHAGMLEHHLPLSKTIGQHAVQWRQQIVRRPQQDGRDFPDQAEDDDVGDDPQSRARRRQPPVVTISAFHACHVLSRPKFRSWRYIRPDDIDPSRACRLHA
jgi:hypothetical protein